MTDAIKLKVLPQFPARLIGRAGIDVAKTNGDYYLDLDYNDFPIITSVPAGATYALVFDPATGRYAQLPISLLGGGAAPATATPLVESGAGTVGISLKYAREDHVHPASGGGGGISDAPNDGSSYGRKSLAWVNVLDPVKNLSDVASAPTSFRNLGGLDTSTLIAITGAVTLTSTAFSRLHQISGTSAAYTITLPTPVGNAGAMIGLVVANTTAATKLYTVASPSGNVGRRTSIVMWAAESVLLLSNGTDWTIIEARQMPFTGVLTRITDQALSSAVAAKINLTAATGDPTGLSIPYDSVNQAFKAPRDGNYIFNGYSYMTQTPTPTFAQAWISDNAAGQTSGVFSYTGTLAGATLYGVSIQNVPANALRSIALYGNGAVVTAAASQVGTRFDYLEVVPSW
ncbi:hypothetical protein JQ582_25995 [Bradyrhizobium japonicum]|uniref:hypothetical protein n=1 Tax=Bradyrhizobium japonicum TaxID=375 RepID=UPI001BAE4A9B|nr:hypothetical protein [Bradyrhizobium japonicum]MBR0747392.1 hypothetical protein [Bradyrhizobium japonicum]